jgi:hypothetical protein
VPWRNHATHFIVAEDNHSPTFLNRSRIFVSSGGVGAAGRGLRDDDPVAVDDQQPALAGRVLLDQWRLDRYWSA